MPQIRNAHGEPGKAKVIEKLQAAMKAKGYSQSAMARFSEEVGEPIHQTKFSSWCRANNTKIIPHYRYLSTIAKILRVPIAYLADESRPVETDMRKLELELQVTELVNRLGLQAAYDRLTVHPNVGELVVPSREGDSGEHAPHREKGPEEIVVQRRKPIKKLVFPRILPNRFRGRSLPD